MENVSLIAVLKHWVSRNKLPLIIILVILFSMVAIASEKMLEITENPEFCGKNCHIMRPYYDSWRTSSHNDVRCVDCHYEPGLVGHAKGKIGGLMQFYNYETTVEEYSGKLYAKVLDKNCRLCHENRLHLEVNYMGVNFSHDNHLLEPKRNVGLTCTSCHSMVVIGMKEHQSVTDPSCSQCHPNIIQEDLGHIVVTTSTCFTCHFKATSEDKTISGCPSCHGPPEQTHKDYTNFDHSKHLSRGYECTTCHVNMSSGTNEIVQKTICLSCHTSKERVGKYDDFEFVHDTHVTKTKIACYNCHLEIKHEPGIKENLCASCHGQEHPSDWLNTHKKEVLIGKVCSDCHKPNFCSDCHATGVSSGKKQI
ncbi:MAG: cytochrome c3 family protein [Candidatus Methanoperedenaceae archaeon]|nr:cytochrome c3 family protein [Candidatus Methanoperedenaceae archaeon]